MADHTETLLFIVDVQVRNAKALGMLNADLAATADAQRSRLVALRDTVGDTAAEHRGLADAINGVTAAQRNGGNGIPTFVRNGDASRVPGDGMVAGIRSRQWGGTRQNPIVTVQESGQAAGLGGLAAASSDRPADQPAAPVPVAAPAVAADKSWLLRAAADVAAKEVAPENDRVLAAITAAARLGRQGGGVNPVLAVAQAVQGAAHDPALAAALGSVHRPSRGGQTNPAAALAAAEAVRATSTTPDRGALAQTLASVLAARQAAGGAPVLLSAAAAAGRLGVSRSKIYDLAGAGALAGATKSPGGAWQIPESSVAALAAGGIGGALGGGGGGAGGGGGGAAAAAGGAAGGGILGKLLWGGGGLFGLAGLGSLAGLAGLGPEHVLMTALGIAGSAAGAAGGAGLLAAGAAGQTLAGGGSDVLAAKTTVSNVNSVRTAMNNLEQAVATYGAGSAQATQAQNQLNFAISQLPPAAAKQEVALANAINNLQDYWQTASAPAQVQATKIAQGGLGVAHTFVPLVANAANTNLGIIQRDLQPLFAWLKGPQGLGIFNDLENQFAHNLPTAVHAGSQAFEVLLRIVDLASRYTGGFTTRLDSLFTRLNGMSNAQLNQEISKLIGDFETWRLFVDALIRDIARLFSNDVGTGQGIIQTLTVMLDKLGRWEASVAGRQSLMTIFTVHKAEVEQLLKVIPLLVSAFAPIEFTLGPALTRAFTLVAKSILDVVKAIEQIPGGTWLVGIALLTSKIGVLGTLLGKAAVAFGLLNKATATNAVLSAAAGGAGAVGGAERAVAGGAAGAEGAAAAAGGGSVLSRLLGGPLAKKLAGTGLGVAAGGAAESAALGLGGAAEGAGMAGLASAIVGAGAAVAPIAAALTPLLVGVGGVAGLVELFHLFSSSAPVTTKYNATQLGQLLQQHGTKALALPAASLPVAPGTPGGSLGVGRPEAQRVGIAATGPSIGDIANTKAMRQALQDWVSTASNAGAVSKMTASQLAGMIHEGDALAKVFPKDAQVIDKFAARLRTDLAPLQGVIGTMTGRWNADGAKGLKTLTDVFDSNTRLIAHIIGLNSDEGRRLMANNIAHMVTDLTAGMEHGRVSVASGLAALNHVLKEGVQQGAISWKTQWADMFTTLGALFAKHKIDASTYTTDLRALMHTAAVHIRQDTSSQYRQMFQYLKGQYDDGYLTATTFHRKVHGAQVAANSQAKVDMQAFAGNVAAGMVEAADAAGKGSGSIVSQLNTALKSLGARPVSDVTVAPASIAKQVLAGLTGFAAGGKVTRPMYMVGEEAPQHEEYVLATNPAYRQRNVGLWAEAGHHLGIPGFAKGGVTGGSLSRMISEANLISSKHYPYVWGGGHNASFSGPYDCSGAVSAVLHAGGYLSAPEVSGQLASFGLPGPGAVTVYANPTHTYMSLMGRFFGTHGADGAGWYAGSPLPGFAVRHPAVSGSLGTIRAPRVSGAGALATADRAGLAKVAKAANAKLNAALMATMSAGQTGGGDWGTFKGSGGITPGSWLSVARQLAARHRWGPGEVQAWRGVENIEDPALSLTAKNPTSSAYGLAQFINGPGEYAQYGGNATTLVGQLAAMANYIAQRYGTPSGALLHEQRAGFYARGGKVGWAGMFGDGGSVTASRPTLAMFGDKGAETATFVPAHKTAGLYGQIVGKPLVVTEQSIKDLTRAVNLLTAGITKMATKQGTQSAFASALQGLRPGTTLKSLGLTGAALAATGLTKGQAQALIGGGPASDAALAALDLSQAATDRSEQAKLTGLYNKAVKTHNTKLAKSLLDQLNAVDSAMATAIAGAQAALVQQIVDTAGQYATVTSALGDSATTLSAIQALNPGTDLGSLGLSPAILATLGLSGAGAQTGTALSIAQGLQSSQGYLTPAQIAAATSGVNAANATLAGEEQPIEGELAYYQSQLPNLTGSDRTNAVAAMQQLAQQLLGLQATMQQNNTGLAALTTATAANTAATTSNTGAMTGSVSFTYRSQNYLASDQVVSLGVGG